MSGAVETVRDWSGYVVGVVAFVGWVYEALAARRERAKNERMVSTLRHAFADPDRPTPVGSAAQRDERLRATLIRAATTGRAFAHVLAECRRTGTVDDDVRQLALDLRERGLLAFPDPLTPQTRLALNA